MIFQATRSHYVLDRIAVGMSLLCAVHCVLLPFALIALPALSATLTGDEAFHRLLLIGVIPTSVIALSMGCRKHGSWRTLLCGFFGLAILVAAAFFGHDLVGETGEKVATVLGASVIALSHFQNLRLCKRQPSFS
jgi:type IV secretory pathway VirB2 component (pilin)